MLRLPDAWIWDFWIADTGSEYHLFFLRASRALHDPDRRHRRASVGHAVSSDLYHWTVLDDALVAGSEPSWDDLATWTGSVVEAGDGTWRMFYTGLSRADDGLVQRVGVATSTDLLTWERDPTPVCVADPRWYDVRGAGDFDEEFWRDPWVYRDPAGDGWHMLITARAKDGPIDQRGVLGHAWSGDLVTWQVGAPRSRSGQGFAQLEVPQVCEVDGHGVLVFSCLGHDLSVEAQRQGTVGGSWAAAIDSPTGPFDVSQAGLLLDDRFYSARLVRDRDGRWQALAFHHREADGSFDGRLSDPIAVHWARPGLLAPAW